MLASQSTILRLDKAKTPNKDPENKGANVAMQNTSGVQQRDHKMERLSPNPPSQIGSDQAQMEKLSCKPLQPQMGHDPSQDKRYIDELLDIVDRAIVNEYGTENTQVLTLDEIFEALKAVETKSRCKKLMREGSSCVSTGDKRNHIHRNDDAEHKRAKLTDCEPADPTFPQLISRPEYCNNMFHFNSFTQQPRTPLSNASLSRTENAHTPHPTPSSTPAAGRVSGRRAEIGVASGVELPLSKSEEKMLLGDLEQDACKMMTHSSQCYF